MSEEATTVISAKTGMGKAYFSTCEDVINGDSAKHSSTLCTN